jgi:ribosomal protein S18 acetylase RimI-like enzyme
MSHTLEDYRLIVSSLGLKTPVLQLLKKLCSIDHAYYLSAPLSRIRFPRLRSDIRFEVARESVFAEMLGHLAGLDALSRLEILARLLFFRRGFTNCYVGRDGRNDIVSMQWLIRPRDNALLKQHYEKRRFLLRDDQVMIENIFIFPRFRGMGVFPTVNHKAITVAKDEGFQVCKAYVNSDNIASLNWYVSLGFRIEKLLTGYHVAGHTWGTVD